MQNAMNDVLAGLGINGTCVRAEAHRHLAFFDVALELRNGAISKLKKRETAEAIAMHLKTKTVPIMRLIPQEGVVRLQVALKDAEPVGLMDLYEGEWLPDNMVFPMLLGEDDEGSKMWMDMNHNPHLLVAGGTGSGKSTLLHTLIANALYVHALRTRNVWLYLGDPKRVEFTDYEIASKGPLKGIVRQVASSYDDVLGMLKGLYEMMELRYKMLQQYKMRSIEENPQKFPLVLCVIDEVSDLMGQQGSKKELEQMLVKLAQKGRAAGIFLVLSTQRPSVDVVTGLIKANFPGRIACKTASRKDSEVVLDRPGAETLLGRGDAVLQNMKHESVRFQVAYTTPTQTIENFNWVKRVAS